VRKVQDAKIQTNGFHYYVTSTFPDLFFTQIAGAAPSTVNAVPLSAASHITGPGGVKMIVVSSGAVAGGNTGKPITITVPGQQGGPPKTVTIAAKPAGQTLLNAGAGQIVTVPASGLQQVTQHTPASQTQPESESPGSTDVLNPPNLN